MRTSAPTGSRWISLDCFVVVPVFPSYAVTSQLSILPHPVNPLQTHTEHRKTVMNAVIHRDTFRLDKKTNFQGCVVANKLQNANTVHDIFATCLKEQMGFRLISIEHLGFDNVSALWQSICSYLKLYYHIHRPVALIFIFCCLLSLWVIMITTYNSMSRDHSEKRPCWCCQTTLGIRS